MNTVDWIYLTILAVSCLLGLWRGFVREAMSLGGWVVALLMSYLCYNTLAAVLDFTGFGETGRAALAFVSVFIVTLMFWAVLTSLIQNALIAVGLGALNRLVGGVFGFLRGAIVLIVANTALLYTPFAEVDIVKGSQAVSATSMLTKTLEPHLPISVRKLIP